MKESFAFFLELPESNFNKFLVHSVSKEAYFDTFLLQAGVIALTDIVKAIDKNFCKYSNDYLPLLLTILTDNDVKKEVKLQVIALIGDIAQNTQNNFIPYLEDTMKLLYGACGLALTYSNDDTDLEEYLQNLRYTLVNTFIFIFYGLEKCKEERHFINHTNTIFKFFEQLVSDSNISLKNEVKDAMLWFIMDVANVYKSNIKDFLSKELAGQLIIDLKATKIPKYEKYASESEQVNF